MELTVTTFLSADGVYQGPGGPTRTAAATPSGGTIPTYRPIGRPEFGSAEV